jgi:hypothetical protein
MYIIYIYSCCVCVSVCVCGCLDVILIHPLIYSHKYTHTHTHILKTGLLKRIDESLTEKGLSPTSSFSPSFFQAGLTGYGLGLLFTFTANIVMQRGQPALLYIVPSLIISALATAAATGRWEEVWAFGTEEEGEKGVRV